ncbi:MAG: tRNA (adenosine(37)-N6)-threonylcarbamoyltransferase complex ATPase subunit type 1 TsaE [Clostridium sp.]|jgi:tRNA threonylcarbamoyladenosine biosynthesis protein TsaE|nr:tRNA (adenosine(37)-N6)-threonylcarbamoyltransferase complex ATPase subunit type 1 TsaE [Clostridium sp.]
MKIITHSADETEQLAAGLAQKLPHGAVVALFGGLGAGKTAFVRGLAKGLGLDCAVTSPTFAIVNEYRADGRLLLTHFDMYRVGTWADLESCGFFDYLESGAVIAIEWSENIVGALPADALRVKITHGEAEGERIIEIEGEPFSAVF